MRLKYTHTHTHTNAGLFTTGPLCESSGGGVGMIKLSMSTGVQLLYNNNNNYYATTTTTAILPIFILYYKHAGNSSQSYCKF